KQHADGDQDDDDSDERHEMSPGKSRRQRAVARMVPAAPLSLEESDAMAQGTRRNPWMFVPSKQPPVISPFALMACGVVSWFFFLKPGTSNERIVPSVRRRRP